MPTPAEIEALFTRTDGTYLCARWGRPIAPVVFGVDDATLTIIKDALSAVATLAGHEMTDMDPELGSNLMVFFVRDWSELTETPNLDRLIPELAALVPRLEGADANQYRFFRFDAAGGIKAAFVFIRMDDALSQVPAETLALSQAVQTILLWSDGAFTQASPLAVTANGTALLKPEIVSVIRAVYTPVLPVTASDASHALRVAARVGAMQ
ncbi:MAG: hypothetical protein ACJATG_001819 [Dinoroseobacter sp.]|jgi:hypothetical protein